MGNNQEFTRNERADYAASMLVGYLADGAKKPYDEVKAYCEKLGISKTELKVARKELNVKTINTGKTWLWHIPDQGTEENA